jgi:hypothetical protein
VEPRCFCIAGDPPHLFVGGRSCLILEHFSVLGLKTRSLLAKSSPHEHSLSLSRSLSLSLSLSLTHTHTHTCRCARTHTYARARMHARMSACVRATCALPWCDYRVRFCGNGVVAPAVNGRPCTRLALMEMLDSSRCLWKLVLTQN